MYAETAQNERTWIKNKKKVTSIQSISLNQSYYFVWIAGVDFQTKVLEVDGRTIALQLWDTAGQER